jgi:hypothetical protein
MRRAMALACLLVGVGCVGPHASGALWAQQDLEREAALFKLSDAQRADRLTRFELGLADETLTAERTRLESELQECPGAVRQPLQPSVGDKARDGVRVRAQSDPARQALVSQLALADWHLRRGQATGDAHFCELARTTLAASPAPTAPTSTPGDDPIARLGMATGSRDGNPASVASAMGVDPNDPLATLSLYALGVTDTVSAPAPLPQYLAAVYGGQVLGPVSNPATTPTALSASPLAASASESEGSAAARVDSLAPSYPTWEPDALYAALRSQPE